MNTVPPSHPDDYLPMSSADTRERPDPDTLSRNTHGATVLKNHSQLRASSGSEILLTGFFLVVKPMHSQVSVSVEFGGASSMDS